MTTPGNGEELRIGGTVQGVGMRPLIWQLAERFHLSGSVRNDGKGVTVTLFGPARAREEFATTLQTSPPPQARITHITRQPLEVETAPPGFTIEASHSGDLATTLAADGATCPECLRELHDPASRHYRYPFTSCSHCGPRLSISRALPWDRANTSLADFTPCPACSSEYEDPTDRRFHAQTNACPACGPRLWLEGSDGHLITTVSDEAISEAAARLRAGAIIAIKGLGGLHLACNATDETAVARLRQGKRRERKPLALMARDLTAIRHYCRVSDDEARQLTSPAAPIVLLQRQPEEVATDAKLAEAIAPGQDELGFMLPYTPLHHLLLAELDHPIVLTSANRPGEPQLIDNATAREQLAEIADALLLHDRDIVQRLDDSLLRCQDGVPRLLRRSRGFCPGPVALPEGFSAAPTILAMGGQQKNTFALLQRHGNRGEVNIAPHIGDLDGPAHRDACQHTIDHYLQLFATSPQLIAIDGHPDYHTSRVGHQLATRHNIPLLRVQHHHAHIAAVMTEHGLPLSGGPVVGIVMDGLGLGDDGALWGAEFLLANYRDYQRMASFQPVALPGGNAATREPWRNTFAALHQSLGWPSVEAGYAQLPLVQRLRDKPLPNLQRMIESGLNAPATSSCGRLFDAVAAALDCHFEGIEFEGEAAMALERLAAPLFSTEEANAYPYRLENKGTLTRIDWQPMWQALLDDLVAMTDKASIAARFHHGLIKALHQQAERLCTQHGCLQVILAGGVFQNRLLSEGLTQRLGSSGLRVLQGEAFPVNDGGLALGQAVIAAARATTATNRKA